MFSYLLGFHQHLEKDRKTPCREKNLFLPTALSVTRGVLKIPTMLFTHFLHYHLKSRDKCPESWVTGNEAQRNGSASQNKRKGGKTSSVQEKSFSEARFGHMRNDGATDALVSGENSPPHLSAPSRCRGGPASAPVGPQRPGSLQQGHTGAHSTWNLVACPQEKPQRSRS